VVTNSDTFNWANLVLPLTGHDFSVGSRDGDACEEACFVVSICDSSSKAYVGSNGAVVRSLLTWITRGWPSKRPDSESILGTKKGIFLLNSVPRSFFLASLENWLGKVPEIGIAGHKLLVSGVLPLVAGAHDNDVFALPEWIIEVSDWSKDNLRVVSDCLISG